MLEYLVDSLAGQSVLCLATVRDSEPSAGLELARDLPPRGRGPDQRAQTR